MKLKSWLAWILMAMLLLTGCSSGQADETDPKKDGVSAIGAKEAEEILGNRLQAAQLSEDEQAPAYVTMTEEKSSYEITSFVENGDLADALLLVRAPDLYSLLKEIEAREGLTDEEKMAALEQELPNAGMLETEVAMQFQLVNGQWQPILTSEFMDAYYGGILRLRAEIYESMMEGEGA